MQEFLGEPLAQKNDFAMTYKIQFELNPINIKFDEIVKIIPRDKLLKKRVKNLYKNKTLAIAVAGDEVVGIVFCRSVFNLQNITWIIHENYREQGIGKGLLKFFLSNSNGLIFAYCRNKVSKKLARGARFKLLGPLAFWAKAIK